MNDDPKFSDSRFGQGHIVSVLIAVPRPSKKKQCFEKINYRLIGELKNTEIVMNNTFWVGLHPGLNKDKLEFVADKIISFL